MQDAIDGSGVPGLPYIPVTHDCDDFARKLQFHLRNDFTFLTAFVAIHPLDADGHYTGDGHALVGVILPYEEIVFIDGQTGKQYKLDADGDGEVTFTDGVPAGVTEGDFSVSIWRDVGDYERRYCSVD